MTRCPVEKNRNKQNRLEKILYFLYILEIQNTYAKAPEGSNWSKSGVQNRFCGSKYLLLV